MCSTTDAPRRRRSIGPSSSSRYATSLALHASCKGNFVRVHEELAAHHGVTVSYPALTAFCRKHRLGHAPPLPKGSYDEVLTPGLEMQHDTSPHDVHIGGALRRVNTAALVLRVFRGPREVAVHALG